MLRHTVSRHSFKPSEFNLSKYSLPIGALALLWLIFSSTLFLLPNEVDKERGMTWENMNYTPHMLMLVFLIQAIYWWLPAPYGARHFYKGPKVQREEEEVADEDRKPLIK